MRNNWEGTPCNVLVVQHTTYMLQGRPLNPPFPTHHPPPTPPPTPMQQERTWKNAKKLQKPPEKGFFMFSWGYRGCWDVFGTGCTPSAWAMRVWSHTFPIHTCITLWVFFQSFFSKHRWLIACIGISNSIN